MSERLGASVSIDGDQLRGNAICAQHCPLGKVCLANNGAVLRLLMNDADRGIDSAKELVHAVVNCEPTELYMATQQGSNNLDDGIPKDGVTIRQVYPCAPSGGMNSPQGKFIF